MDILIPIIVVALGALLTYLSYMWRQRQGRNAERKSLGSSISAELYSNKSIVVGLILGFWDALDVGAEHLPPSKPKVQNSIFYVMQKKLGLIEPEIAAQIIYLYARLDAFIQQHELLQVYLCNDSSDDWPPRGGFATHRMTLVSLGDEISKDTDEIIRHFNNGLLIGEGDVTFDISPHMQVQRAQKFLRDEKRYLESRNMLQTVEDYLKALFRR